KEIRRWTMKKRKQRGWNPPIYSLGFSPDGKTLITITYDKEICRWAVPTGNLLHKASFQYPKDQNIHPHKVSFLSDGRMLAAGDYLKEVVEGGKGIRGLFVWDMATGKEVCELREEEKRDGFMVVTAFSPDGKLLATGKNKEIFLWD